MKIKERAEVRCIDGGREVAFVKEEPVTAPQ